MTRSQTTTAVTLLREAADLRSQALVAEQSFATLHKVDDLRRQQFAKENAFVKLMRPVYESLTMDEGMALSKRLHRLAGV